MRPLLWPSMLFLVLFSLISCGSYEEVHEKSYRLYFDTKDVQILDEADRLIERYNRNLGFVALKMVKTVQEANSTALFKTKLREVEGKLGYGQWVTETKTDSGFKRFQGKDMTRTIRYSMALEFDLVFFKERAGLDDSDPEYQRLEALFCHETGHGQQMDHEEDRTDIMFPVIHEAKSYDFDRYFQRVKAFYQ